MGSVPELPAISCLEIKASERENTISGKYWLDPTGTGKAILINCDMAIGGRSYSFLFELFYIFITMIFLVSISSRYIEANSWMLAMEREF